MSNSCDHKATIDAVRAALSPARLGRYESEAGVQGDGDLAALILYAWNAQVSGALLSPLHICEVVVRNAVANALEANYGARWPWSPTFERSLPDPLQGYSPRKDLQSARRAAATTGKVIPELKFVFWQKMFTSRYDTRIWNTYLRRVMPNLDPAKTIPELRTAIYNDMEMVRLLRNRIAHHEPIFTRALGDDYRVIHALIERCCAVTAGWMNSNQTATALIANKP
ncbi:MAG: hypothetical protein ORN29_02170 [Rhodoferax sp.]|nr:hypothetical protein [Rhodoferax sp.]